MTRFLAYFDCAQYKQKGIVHIVPLLVVVLVIAAVAVWFFTSKQDLRLPQTSNVSLEEKIGSLKLKPFKDISSDNKNYTAIKYLSREGILEADKDGNFNPKKTLTRGEWAVMLVKLAGVKPDQEKYKNCYSDVGQGEAEAAICYAKEQGWLEGNSKEQTSWNFVKTANAQEDKEKFNLNEPIINAEAAGSLARMMVWEPGKDPTNEEALNSANAGKILESQNAGGTLIRENAAGFVFRSLATVPFNRSEYEENFDNSVAKYSVNDLINPRPEKGSSGPSKGAQIDYWANNSGIGIEAATAVVDNTSSHDEALKTVRQIRYDMRLAEEERATGQKLPSYDAFVPLQQVFESRGGISADDVIMRRGVAGDETNVITADPMINARDGFEIRVMLDENYQVVPKSEWESGNIKHIMELSHHSFYDIGQVADIYLTRVDPNWAGKANIMMVDVPEGFVANDETVFDSGGVINAAAGSEKWYNFDNPEGLEAMYQQVLEDIESKVGTEIIKPEQPTENSSEELGNGNQQEDASPSKRDCWKEFSDSLQKCMKEHNACINDCVQRSRNGQALYKACASPCRATSADCRAVSSAAYDSCVEERRQGK